MQTQIEKARPEDLDDLLQLLDESQLPADGFREHLATALVARQAGQIVGSAALEIYRDGALLRSVAVAPEIQKQGIGRELTEAALRLAQELHAPAVYLLTTN